MNTITVPVGSYGNRERFIIRITQVEVKTRGGTACVSRAIAARIATTGETDRQAYQNMVDLINSGSFGGFLSQVTPQV